MGAGGSKKEVTCEEVAVSEIMPNSIESGFSMLDPESLNVNGK